MSGLDHSGKGAVLAGFFRHGVRWYDIAVLMAYPTLGALFGLPELSLPSLARLIVFTLANLLFVTQIYVYNDWADACLNPQEPLTRSRQALKPGALTAGQALALCAVLVAMSLVIYLVLSITLFMVALIIEALTALYSHPRLNFKGRPVMSTVIHFLFAVLFFMAGWAAFNDLTPVSWRLAVFFGLVLSGGHFSNEIEDFYEDLASGIRTNAVVFGQRLMFRTGLTLFLVSSLWFAFAVGPCLPDPIYSWLGYALVLIWGTSVYRYRSWKGGDSILEFRRLYRAVYASLALTLAVIRLTEVL